MKTTFQYLFSAVLGILTGIIGAYLVGYLAAIALPNEVFDWFKKYFSNVSAMITIDVITQFFAFGLFGIVSGVLIARFSGRVMKSSLFVYYIGFLIYLSVGVSLLHNMSIQAPYAVSYIKVTYGLPVLVLPLCVMVSAYLARRRMAKNA